MKKIFMLLVIVLFSVAAFAQQSVQDVIYLKNGTIVRGKIIEQLPNQGLKVYTSNRTILELKGDEIQKMEKENTTQDIAVQSDEEPLSAGNIIIGGSAEADWLKQDYSGSISKRFLIGLYPKLEYFVIDNLAIGGSVNVGFRSSGGDKSFTIGVGPEARYYFDNGIFVMASTMLMYVTHDKDKYFLLKPGVGYSFFLNSKVAIEPAFVYEFSSEKWNTGFSEAKGKTNRIGIEVGIVVWL